MEKKTGDNGSTESTETRECNIITTSVILSPHVTVGRPTNTSRLTRTPEVVRIGM